MERYVFSKSLPISKDQVENNDDDVDNTILYRMPSGPKSPKAHGKRPSLIQHGILCDTNPCTVNKPQIAIGKTLK